MAATPAETAAADANSNRTDRHYEYVMLINPEMHEQSEKISGGYAQVITEANGSITRTEGWGVRSLAYKIGKYSRASYVLLNFSCSQQDGAIVSQALSDKSTYDESVMRTLLVRTNSAPDSPSAVARAAAKKLESDEQESKSK